MEPQLLNIKRSQLTWFKVTVGTRVGLGPNSAQFNQVGSGSLSLSQVLGLRVTIL